MGNKYNRKLIRIGKSGLGVILPKPWLKYYDLNYGDSVEMISSDRVEIKPIQEGNNAHQPRIG